MALGWRRSYIRYRSFFMNIYRVYKTKPDLKMFLEIVLSLFTIATFALMALRPTALTITQLLQDIAAKQVTVAKMDQKIENLASAQDVFQADVQRLNFLTQAIPDTPSPETFARQMEGLAARHGVTLNSLVMDETTLIGEIEVSEDSSETPDLPASTGGVPLSLNVIGGYTSLISFLADLENLRRPLKVDQAIISTAETESGKTLALSVVGRIPYFSK